MKRNNHLLKAVFWDTPKLIDPNYLNKYLQKAKQSRNFNAYRWVLSRFLEHGRTRDAMHYFSLHEVKEQLPHLRLTPYTRKKWERLVEVYEGQT